MYVCTQTHDGPAIYTRHTRQVRCSVTLLVPSLAFLSLFTMPDDAIEPSTSLPETIRRTVAAAPPSLTASSCITPASSGLKTRAQPDNDDNPTPEPHHTSSRPSHPNLDHIPRSSRPRIYFPSIAYV